MNGKRRKALARQFRSLNGRDPNRTIAVYVDNTNTFRNEHGVNEFESAYEKDGELRHNKIMGVAVPSELRAMKKAYNQGLSA